jgi:hypothetical protein
MKLRVIVWVLAVVGIGVPARAQAPVPAPRLFSDEAIGRAIARMPIEISQVDPRADWSRVMGLSAAQPIIVRTRGGAPRRGRFVSADASTLTVVDLEAPGTPTLRLARTDVDEILQRTGRRGSVLGAAIGAGGGVLLGIVSAINLAFMDCGGSCGDERFLIGLSLVGIPVAGGFAGYYLPGDSRRLTTIYLRPPG